MFSTDHDCQNTALLLSEGNFYVKFQLSNTLAMAMQLGYMKALKKIKVGGGGRAEYLSLFHFTKYVVGV